MTDSDFQEGDRLSLSASITVPVGNYQSIKPSATITRVIGRNPQEDLDEMSGLLRVAMLKSAIVEVEGLDALIEAVSEDGLDGLLGYCKEQVDSELEESITRRRVAPSVGKCLIKKHLLRHIQEEKDGA
jgi:hypothetical protein